MDLTRMSSKEIASLLATKTVYVRQLESMVKAKNGDPNSAYLTRRQILVDQAERAQTALDMFDHDTERAAELLPRAKREVAAITLYQAASEQRGKLSRLARLQEELREAEIEAESVGLSLND